MSRKIIDGNHDANQPLWTEDKVCEFLGIQPKALMRFRQELGLPFMKFSRRCLRFRPSAIVDWAVRNEKSLRG